MLPAHAPGPGRETPAVTATAGDERRLTRDPRLWRVIIAASIGVFAIELDFFAVQAALPDMARDLGTSVTTLQWVISGYMLANGATLIVGGRVGDLLGRRRWLVIGIAVFGLSSLAGGLAPTDWFLVLMRLVQGVAAAFAFPLCLAVVTNAFPQAKVERAVGTVFGIAAVGQALGPLIGGGLTALFNWRAVLLVNVDPAAAHAKAIGPQVVEGHAAHRVAPDADERDEPTGRLAHVLEHELAAHAQHVDVLAEAGGHGRVPTEGVGAGPLGVLDVLDVRVPAFEQPADVLGRARRGELLPGPAAAVQFRRAHSLDKDPS